MRLIDAHKLWDVMNKAILNHIVTNTLWNTLKSVIENAPTIDAVEVVRCKECRYFKKIVERSDSGLCHRDIVASAWKENGYCSRGERREESEA